MARSGLPSNTRFLGLIRAHNANSIFIGSVVFEGLTIMTDRQADRQTDQPTDWQDWQTDHATPSGNNRPHLCMQYCDAA